MSWPKSVDDAIRVLNEIHAEDPTVMPALIAFRVPCNQEIGDHPAVQVGLREGADKADLENGYEVGFLGILNGIFGTMPSTETGYICAHYDTDGRLTHFGSLEPTWEARPE